MLLSISKSLYNNLPRKYLSKLNSFEIKDSFPNNNKYSNIFSYYIQKIFISNDNLTDLHRWCNTTSPRYKDTCDWEKKLDFAGRDNCYSSQIKSRYFDHNFKK